MPQEKILEVFVNNPDSDGVIITENLKYAGFLAAKSLLNIMNEKNLAMAREINPLTQLPGNTLINRYIIDSFSDMNNIYYFIYFYFNYFKPFNDHFGFRRGDRAILLFADILKKEYTEKKCFVGHVGGDDFFAGVEEKGFTMEAQKDRVGKIIEKFNSFAAAFYDSEDLSRGYYLSSNRQGKTVKFPLLTVSAGIVEIPCGERTLGEDDIPPKPAELKIKAKRAGNKIASFRFS